jgi:hypothetical protein
MKPALKLPPSVYAHWFRTGLKHAHDVGTITVTVSIMRAIVRGRLQHPLVTLPQATAWLDGLHSSGL